MKADPGGRTVYVVGLGYLVAGIAGSIPLGAYVMKADPGGRAVYVVSLGYLVAGIAGSIPLGAWMFVSCVICCIVLCR
jgi:hypothetical protein